MLNIVKKEATFYLYFANKQNRTRALLEEFTTFPGGW